MSDRRGVLAGGLAVLAAGCAGMPIQTGEQRMYGLIGRMKAHPGQRAALADILLLGLRDMPGCLSYIVAEDPADPDALWITETWTDAASHMASLGLPSVQAAIQRGRPLIAGMDRRQETRPLGGVGLPRP